MLAQRSSHVAVSQHPRAQRRMILSSGSSDLSDSDDPPPTPKYGGKKADDAIPLEKNAGLLMAVCELLTIWGNGCFRSI